MSFKTSETTIGSAVATDGTFTLDYPEATNAGSFADFGHEIWIDKFQRLLKSPADFTISFGGSNITVTYKGATSIPSGARATAQLNVLGADDEQLEIDYTDGEVKRVFPTNTVTIGLGAPDAADADGVCASQAGSTDTAMTINGALASGGAVEFDVPRNVVAAWTGTAVLTITGEDEYGKTVVESSASGTSLAGKKAFKKITKVVPSANITGATVGSGDVLGLPVYLPSDGLVLAELEDGSDATAGTLVAGVDDAATATTGDVRGTYDPNSAANGSRVFELVAVLPDAKYKGVAQYAG